ncbi:MFS transporter [Propionibacterium cyclohexanicum]|uniref:MFS transporter n=1 Tax=Propionibacterium cyclohexanicum TaxID=64702 RepID=UPI00115FFE3C|nr:MFS transporter [Propionibacterium cyclohexanicum]
MNAVERAVARLRTAGFIAALGNGLTGVVLSVTLSQALPASAVAGSLGALSVGMLISFAAGGKHADMSDRVSSMVHSDWVRAGMNLLIVAGVLVAGPAGIALAVAGCLGNGLMAGFFRPAQSSLWASIVPRNRLSATLATNSFVNRLGLAAGGALGGVLLAVRQNVLGLAIDAGTFIATAVIVHALRDPRKAAANRSEEPQAEAVARTWSRVVERLRVDRDWADILALTRKSTWMRLWFICNLNMSWAAGLTSVVVPVVLVRQYSDGEIGLFQSISVIALLAGSLIALLVRRIPGAGVFDAWSSVGSALSYLAVGLGARAGLASAVRFTSYFSQSVASPRLGAYVAEQFPERERGRIYAAQQGVSGVLAPVGMLAGGVLLTWSDPQGVLVISSGLCVLFGLIPLVNPAYWDLKVTQAATLTERHSVPQMNEPKSSA